MSTRTFCDYPGCGHGATTRIVEEPYGDVPEIMGRPTRGSSLDACDVHRTVTHPGWWCRNHEETLRQQALREVREAS